MTAQSYELFIVKLIFVRHEEKVRTIAGSDLIGLLISLNANLQNQFKGTAKVYQKAGPGT
jgi:hypothetical protein